jgi:hypothetical protein
MTTAQQRRLEARERRREAFRPVVTHVVAFAVGALLIAVTVRNHTGVSASVVGSSQSGKNLRSYRG